MHQKKPFYLVVSLAKSYVGVVAQEIHGGAMAVTNVRKLALYNNTIQMRCAVIAASQTQLTLAKLRDETTDITSQAQLIV